LSRTQVWNGLGKLESQIKAGVWPEAAFILLARRLFGQGSNKPKETGLNIAGNGQITFAGGQTFPGVGTVTSVGSGAGLTGGPITTSGTLSIATGGVSNAMLTNPSRTVAAGADWFWEGNVAVAKIELPPKFDFGSKLTPWEQRRAEGKALRRAVPRESHAEWDPGKDRPDPM